MSDGRSSDVSSGRIRTRCRMMKVFILTFGNQYDGFVIVGVFPTLEAAVAAKEEEEKGYTYKIEEHQMKLTTQTFDF